MSTSRVRCDESSLLSTLERLLEIEATEVKGALDQASDLVGEALGAEKVDSFLYDPGIDTLVAVGTSSTPLARRQREIGMDRLPVSNGGRTVEVFQTGGSYITGRAHEDGGVLPGIKEGLGVRSMVAVPFEVAGERRGVLNASSTRLDAFDADDLAFLQAVARWVGIVVHRAELVERIARDTAEQARRIAAEELVTVLAHDLGNHFTPLKARIDLLRTRARREGRQADLQHAEEAGAALARLRNLVTDLLDVGRLEQGIFALSPEPMDLAALAHETAEVLETRDSPIHVRAPEDLPVLADPDRVRQALENLLTNAIKHSPHGVPVSLEVREEARDGSRCAVLEVRDEGPGIPGDVLPRLFTRFSAGPGSTGLGLGLYLAHSIAHAHGGALTVQSSPGHGAIFRLSIPLGDIAG